MAAVAHHPKICLILGNPISHSLSPKMHTAGYHALDIADKFCFSSAKIESHDLSEAIKAIKLLKIRGAACTMPLKEALVPLVDWLDPHAREIGAVNTLVLEHDRLKGYNTDWLGLAKPLEEIRSLAGEEALVLGAGGAARAAIYALKSLGMRITLTNRSPDKAEELTKQFSISSLSWEVRERAKQWSVIVNTTSLGMGATIEQSPLPNFEFTPNQIVFETIYAPRTTKLLQMAQTKGSVVLRGTDMLLHQGVAQFELFTGLSAPLEAMKQALE